MSDISYKYIVEEKDHNHKTISHLETSNPWLSFADIMIKINNNIKKGERVRCVSSYNFSEFSLRIYSFTYFFISQNGSIRTINLNTIPKVNSGTFYNKKLTSEIYCRDAYIDDLKLTILHVKKYLEYDVNGIYVLLLYGLCCFDHPLWLDFKLKYGNFEVEMSCVLAM